jgi:integrase
MPNLYIQITVGKSGQPRRSWIYKYKTGGKTHEAGLGSYPATSISQARTKARDMAALRANGIDPLAKKSAEKAEAAIPTWTFEQAAGAFLAHITKQRANSKFPLVTAKAWRSTLRRHVFPRIGNMDCRAIKHEHVASILAPIAVARGASKRAGLGGPTVAAQLRSRVERILDFAAVNGRRDPNLPNPASPRLFKDVLGSAPTTIHHRAAPLAEVPAIYQQLVSMPSNTILNAIKFTMLTAARIREVLDASWGEIDLDKGLFTIPPSRSKTATEHIIPLSAAALEILAQQAAIRCSDTIFPGRFGGPMSSPAPARTLARLGVTATSIHGFRSSWLSWAAENGIDDNVAELALNHRIGNAVQQAYFRTTLLEKRRAALSKYADWLRGIEPAATVLRFPKAAAE